MPMDIMAIISVIGTLVLILAVFVGAYFVTRIVGMKYDGSNSTGKSKLVILERKVLGKEQALVLVKIADKVILLGVTPQQIDKLDTFAMEDFPEDTQATKPQQGFVDMLKDAVVKNKLHPKDDLSK